MKKIILVDGNNLLFRSYYATAYTGNVMRNSKGFPTNALYGFALMMNKIIEEENPKYIAVAFDIGINFRRQKFDSYKDGRAKTPDDLKAQMPKARTLLDKMGIKYFELEPYEADDIIGTLAKEVNKDKDFVGTIISSDKDLLQLISDEIDVKLLKQKDYIRYNHDTFVKDYGFEPIRMIDYKALAGDSSDNIPGVKGIGEKSAINLLQKYDTIEDIYEHIDEISGKTKEKLINDKKAAFDSKYLATIYLDVPIDTDLNKLEYIGPKEEELVEFYKDLEFYSFVKKFEKKETITNLNYKIIDNILQLESSEEYSIFIECDNINYHNGKIKGMSISTKNNNYYVEESNVLNIIDKIKDKVLYTFDLKKNMSLLHNKNINCNYDLMIASYLLEESNSDDISDILIKHDINVLSIHDSIKNGFNIEDSIKKSRYIFDSRTTYINKLKMENMYDLFNDIEMPLVEVLSDMEECGIVCKKDVLNKMGDVYKEKIEALTKKIYEQAGMEFNIASPKQLGEVLFDKLQLPYAKKTKSGYSTDVKVLNKLVNIHPIINDILEYRNATKLYNTYIIGLQEYIKEDNKIHTIYRQNLTRTGRLSSIDPNLQNIPARDSEGRKIRQAFYPSNDLLLSCDYSQIELRILAHISGSKELIEAFNKGEDIHSRVAADIYGVDIKDVSKEMRKSAKAVIFGIVYGITGFGLGEDLGIKQGDAKKFIEKYYELYPGVKRYMDNIVKEAYASGEVRSLFNRKRTIEELQSSVYMVRLSGERIALNTPIQGTEADIIKKAMVLIYKAFKNNNIKSKMIMQVHDELIFDCLKEEKDKVVSLVQDIMENVIKLDVPIIVSHDFGDNWYNTK